MPTISIQGVFTGRITGILEKCYRNDGIGQWRPTHTEHLVEVPAEEGAENAALLQLKPFFQDEASVGALLTNIVTGVADYTGIDV